MFGALRKLEGANDHPSLPVSLRVNCQLMRDKAAIAMSLLNTFFPRRKVLEPSHVAMSSSVKEFLINADFDAAPPITINELQSAIDLLRKAQLLVYTALDLM